MTYDRNIDARRRLAAMSPVRDTCPPGGSSRPHRPATFTLYRETESGHWCGLELPAAINLIETRFGGIAGLNTAGAGDPIRFMPETWAAYGAGRDGIRRGTLSWRRALSGRERIREQPRPRHLRL